MTHSDKDEKRTGEVGVAEGIAFALIERTWQRLGMDRVGGDKRCWRMEVWSWRALCRRDRCDLSDRGDDLGMPGDVTRCVVRCHAAAVAHSHVP